MRRIVALVLAGALFSGCGGGPRQTEEGLRFEEHNAPWPDGFQELVAGECLKIGDRLETIKGQELPAAIGLGDAPCFFADHLTGGGAVADFDKDGLDDVVWTRGYLAPPVLLSNDGAWGFTDQSEQAWGGADLTGAMGAAVADVDNDADLDLLFTTYVKREMFLMLNDGSGRFIKAGTERGLTSPTGELLFGASAVFADVDNDGWLDLHVNNYRMIEATRRVGVELTRLFRNLGGKGKPGFFEDVTAEAGVQMRRKDGADLTFVSTFHDFNHDGRLDLFATSDFNTSRVFENNGDWTFTDITETLPIVGEESAMGVAIGDLSGDGTIEVFLAAASEFPCSIETATGMISRRLDYISGNRVYSLRPDGVRDVTDVYGMRDGGWGWGVVMADFANDGVLDAMMVGQYGIVPGMSPSDCRSAGSNHPVLRLWEGGREEYYPEVSNEAGLSSTGRPRSPVVADLDNDGDEDLVVFQSNLPPRLFENVSVSGGYLRIRFPESRHGQNARIDVELSDGRNLTRWANTMNGTFTGVYSNVVVGVGKAETATVVRVSFPGGNLPQEFFDVPVNSEVVTR
jgi:hypothetical protein